MFFTASLAALTLAVSPASAPVLHASAEQLSWTYATSNAAFVVEEKYAGGVGFVPVGKVKTFAPTPIEGATEYFRVRPQHRNKAWSNQASIAFPNLKAEKEAAEKAQHEKEAAEAAEKTQHEKEAAEKTQHEKEAAEKAQKEKEAAEKEASIGCTTIVSSAAAINGAISKGGTVCLTAGTYGNISLTTTPSSQTTVTSVPGAHVATGGVNIAASNLTVSQLHVTGSINIASGNNNVIEHNEVSGGGYGISILAPIATPAKNTTIAWNRIHDTSHTSEGDALRFDGWEKVKVIGNDIYNIAECPAHNCHTDTLESYEAEAETRGLLIERNYVHDDTAVQGLPFLKDGDVQEVSILDNLSVRDTSFEQVNGFWVDDNTKGLLIEHNTYLTSNVIAAGGRAASPSATVKNNVLQEFNVNGGGYALTEDFNTYTGNNQWSFKLGPNDTKGTPAFTNPAADNYIVPGGPGVDWQPSQYVYGPAA